MEQTGTKPMDSSAPHISKRAFVDIRAFDTGTVIAVIALLTGLGIIFNILLIPLQRDITHIEKRMDSFGIELKEFRTELKEFGIELKGIKERQIHFEESLKQLKDDNTEMKLRQVRIEEKIDKILKNRP